MTGRHFAVHNSKDFVLYTENDWSHKLGELLQQERYWAFREKTALAAGACEEIIGV